MSSGAPSTTAHAQAQSPDRNDRPAAPAAAEPVRTTRIGPVEQVAHDPRVQRNNELVRRRGRLWLRPAWWMRPVHGDRRGAAGPAGPALTTFMILAGPECSSPDAAGPRRRWHDRRVQRPLAPGDRPGHLDHAELLGVAEQTTRRPGDAVATATASTLGHRSRQCGPATKLRTQPAPSIVRPPHRRSCGLGHGDVTLRRHQAGLEIAVGGADRSPPNVRTRR
jgi:hypothetical protein